MAALKAWEEAGEGGDRSFLVRFAWLSIGAALLTMALKAGAYFITNSVGLLSDALESGVNLIASFLSLSALKIAARPPDEEHAYGHGKAEYFSSGAEGLMILVAAVVMGSIGIGRIIDPAPLHNLDLGLLVMVMAALVNVAVAQILIRVAQRHRSVALEAGGHHLMTDFWTTIAVLLGIGAIWLSGWYILDPLIALAIGAHVGWVGFRLVQRSTLGLMDTALPDADVTAISAVLDRYTPQGVRYHALRTRQAGARSFVSLHIQVPGRWTVQQGHDLLEAIEHDVRAAVPSATVFTHLEPLEDPRSWTDQHLDR